MSKFHEVMVEVVVAQLKNGKDKKNKVYSIQIWKRKQIYLNVENANKGNVHIMKCRLGPQMNPLQSLSHVSIQLVKINGVLVKV